jgi:hypothetical protein
MNDLHQTMTRPVNQDEFNQWVREFKVSSAYTEYDTKQMVLRDEDRRLESKDYLTNKSTKRNKKSIIQKIIKSLI